MTRFTLGGRTIDTDPKHDDHSCNERECQPPCPCSCHVHTREAIDELIDAIDLFRKATEDGIDLELRQMVAIKNDAQMIVDWATMCIGEIQYPNSANN